MDTQKQTELGMFKLALLTVSSSLPPLQATFVHKNAITCLMLLKMYRLPQMNVPPTVCPVRTQRPLYTDPNPPLPSTSPIS